MIRWHEWIFTFRYDLLLARLSGLAGVDLIVRPYDRADGNSPAADFLSVVGLGGTPLGVLEPPHANRRPDLHLVAQQYLVNRPGLHLDEAQIIALTEPLRMLKTAPRMSRERQIQFADAFGDSNRAVCEAYHLPTFARMQLDSLVTNEGPSLEDVFGTDLMRAEHHAAL